MIHRRKHKQKQEHTKHNPQIQQYKNKHQKTSQNINNKNNKTKHTITTQRSKQTQHNNTYIYIHK